MKGGTAGRGRVNGVISREVNITTAAPGGGGGGGLAVNSRWRQKRRRGIMWKLLMMAQILNRSGSVASSVLPRFLHRMPQDNNAEEEAAATHIARL